MGNYLLRRFIVFILVLAGVSLLSFALVDLFGRDPAEIIARRTNIHATYEQIEVVRKSMGLDRPFPERFLSWLKVCSGVMSGYRSTLLSRSWRTSGVIFLFRWKWWGCLFCG